MKSNPLASCNLQPSSFILETKMRFPLSLTASMVGYLACKKVAGPPFSPGADAGTFARLQPELHRLWPHSRVFPDDQEENVGRGMSGLGGRSGAPIVSICGGEPLIYPEIGTSGASHSTAPQTHLPVYQRRVSPEDNWQEFQPTSHFFFNVHLDGLERDARSGRRTSGRFPGRRGRYPGGEEARASASAPTPRFTRKPTRRRSMLCFAYLTTLGVDGFLVSPAYGYAGGPGDPILKRRPRSS